MVLRLLFLHSSTGLLETLLLLLLLEMLVLLKPLLLDSLRLLESLILLEPLVLLEPLILLIALRLLIILLLEALLRESSRLRTRPQRTRKRSFPINTSPSNNPIILIYPNSPQLGLLRPPRRIGPVQIIHVPVELEIHVAHRVEVPDRQLHHGVGLEDRLVAVALGLELGERQRRLAGVADLAPVPPRVRVLGEVLGREAADAHLVDVDAALLVREALLDHLHVDFEYFDCLFGVELGVV